MEDGQPIVYSLYVYAPNKVAPIIFTVAFAISAMGHLWQCHLYKSWKLLGLHPLCALFYTAGYALREYGVYNYLYSFENLIIFILSQVLIYICPPLLELANYHVLGRLMFYVPHCAPISPSRVLSLFGGLIALVEAMNGLGVAFTSNPSATKSKQEMGSNLTVASIALQFCVIATCVVLASIFHWRCVRAGIKKRFVLTLLVTLYVSVVLILIRCIYRLVEHLGSVSLQIDNEEALKQLTPLLRYEWYFYIFEATVMFFNSALWNLWNPGRFIPCDHDIYLAHDGKTELKRFEDEDTRPLLAKAGSILTFGMLFPKRNRQQATEELDSFPDRENA